MLTKLPDEVPAHARHRKDEQSLSRASDGEISFYFSEKISGKYDIQGSAMNNAHNSPTCCASILPLNIQSGAYRKKEPCRLQQDS